MANSVLPNTILIVEDEEKLAAILVDYFHQAGYSTHHLSDGNGVVQWVKTHTPDAVLLDIMLPNKSGIELCKEIRQFSNVPILMVTAKVDEIDRLLGLELGADDYICKPFSPREVVARVKAVLRRATTEGVINLGIELDENRLTARILSQMVELTAVEFQLLKPMVAKPDWIFSRDKLMDTMYSDHRIVSNRTIDSHIKKLRKKLASISDGKDWIQSVYGCGYRINKDG